MSTDELFDFFKMFDDAYRPMSKGHRALWGGALKDRDGDRVFKALNRAMADSNSAPSLRKFQGKYLAEVNEWENRYDTLEDSKERVSGDGEPVISLDVWKRRHPEEWAACQAKLGNSVFATPFRHHREREPGEDDMGAGVPNSLRRGRPVRGVESASPRLPGVGVEDMVDGKLPWGEE